MTSLKNEAEAYEPPKTLNIADLPSFDVNEPMEDFEGENSEGKPFKYKALVRDGKEYRVPGVVLGSLKTVMANMPGQDIFKVIKEGQGRATKYQVIPVTEKTEQATAE